MDSFEIKAVIFDMDGLMFDTERIAIAAWDFAGEKMGLGKAGRLVYETLGMNEEASGAVWAQHFGDRYDPEALRRYTSEFANKYYSENKVPVKKGLYALLEYLKSHGYKTALASSSPRRAVDRNLNDAGISEYFGCIVTGDMIKISKPAPDIYLKACELLGEEPRRCIALEDSRNGLWSAHSAGCNTVMVPDLWQPDPETEKILYARLGDLEKVRDFLAGRD